MNHYAQRAAITAGIVNGVPLTALCGATMLPRNQSANAIPGNEVGNRKLTTCPDCEIFYRALRGESASRRIEYEPESVISLAERALSLGMTVRELFVRELIT